MPLGGNRKGTRAAAPQYRNRLGADRTFGMARAGTLWSWGVYFGVILIIEKLWLLRALDKCPAFVGHVYSLILIVLGWVIFWTDSFSRMATYIAHYVRRCAALVDENFLYLATSRVWLLIFFARSAPRRWSNAYANVSRGLRRCEAARLCWAGWNRRFCWRCSPCRLHFLVSGSYNPFLYFNFFRGGR